MDKDKKEAFKVINKQARILFALMYGLHEFKEESDKFLLDPHEHRLFQSVRSKLDRLIFITDDRGEDE